jgi:hypothetical protein
LRGAEILGFGLLFRLQEWLLGGTKGPWTDLLRVDILNTIGVSMMLMGVVCWLAGISFGSSAKAGALRIWNIFLAAAIGMTISLISPLIWTTWRPRFLPWFLETYINGVHVFDKPQAWLFPIFPWSALETVAMITVGGSAIGAFAWWLDSLPTTLYVNYDFWHTSPNFFLIRVGLVALILGGAYAWCRWGAGQRGFSPMIEMGKSSLLVYWVHVELVYGGLSIMTKRNHTVGEATFGLAVIFVSMVLLATIRNGTKGRGKEIRAWFADKIKFKRGAVAIGAEPTKLQRCEEIV